MDFDNFDIKKYLPSPEQMAEDDDYKRRVRMGGDVLSLLNTPSAAEIYSGAKIARPNYQEQADNAVKDTPSGLERASKIASTLSTYQTAMKNKADAEKAAADALLASKVVPPEKLAEYAALGQKIPAGITYGELNKSYPELKKLRDQKFSADVTYGARRSNMEHGIEERNDNTTHNKIVDKLKSDPNLNQRLTQYNNLSNALAIIANAEHVTPQQVAEFQQAVRSNIGVKGTGGVEERADTQIKTLGLNAENFKQFLTGEPATLAKDSNLIKHLQDLAKVEQANIRKQKDNKIAALTSGHKSVYDRRPDLKADLRDSVDAVGSQFDDSPSIQSPPPAASAVGGLTPEEQKELAELEAKFGKKQ